MGTILHSLSHSITTEKIRIVNSISKYYRKLKRGKNCAIIYKKAKVLGNFYNKNIYLQLLSKMNSLQRLFLNKYVSFIIYKTILLYKSKFLKFKILEFSNTSKVFTTMSNNNNRPTKTNNIFNKSRDYGQKYW